MFRLVYFLCSVLGLVICQRDGGNGGNGGNGDDNLPPSCNSPIYCYGELLDTVQRARIYNDSKEFVDRKLKEDVNATLKNFENLMQSTNRNPSRDEIKKFVDDYFEAGDELEQWNLPDYDPNPKFLKRIDDEQMKNFAADVIHIWPKLAKRIKSEVKENRDKYSIIPIPNGFIVPGGRFKETYYWDTYWIIQGLLISDMTMTARGMIENFIYMVRNYGLVPNGGRVYYLERSQPPLLTAMVYNYIKKTNDIQWLRDNIKYLNNELMFWLTKRTTEVKRNNQKYTMAHYNAPSAGPRPESYREDLISANYFKTKQEKQDFFTKIKSGAETGWDFSSRWIFDDNGGINANLSLIDTPRVIPVDLNSFLCQAFEYISELYTLTGDLTKSLHWQEKHLHFKKSIQQLFWNEKDGIWYDFDNKLSKQRNYFYPSNVSPLWTGCVNQNRRYNLGKRVLKYLDGTKALLSPGGIPTSDYQTGEQWDYPNAWAPLQAIIIQGLYYSGNKEARNKARQLADKWLVANIRGYNETGDIFEKYDAAHSGKAGGGGEYTVQAGFGWTNGFALELIKLYYTKNDNDTNFDPISHLIGRRWRSAINT